MDALDGDNNDDFIIRVVRVIKVMMMINVIVLTMVMILILMMILILNEWHGLSEINSGRLKAKQTMKLLLQEMQIDHYFFDSLSDFSLSHDRVKSVYQARS